MTAEDLAKEFFKIMYPGAIWDPAGISEIHLRLSMQEMFIDAASEYWLLKKNFTASTVTPSSGLPWHINTSGFYGGVTSTTPSRSTPSGTPQASGTCPSCGHKGDWINLALVCPTHGRFAG